jgi:hypothetical protein
MQVVAFCSEPFLVADEADLFRSCTAGEGLGDHNPNCRTGLCVNGVIDATIRSMCLVVCTADSDCPGGRCVEVTGSVLEGANIPGSGIKSCFR